jgi:hypothetical protein
MGRAHSVLVGESLHVHHPAIPDIRWQISDFGCRSRTVRPAADRVDRTVNIVNSSSGVAWLEWPVREIQTGGWQAVRIGRWITESPNYPLQETLRVAAGSKRVLTEAQRPKPPRHGGSIANQANLPRSSR